MSPCGGKLFDSVCLSVCSQHNLKTNTKVFKLDIENDVYPRSKDGFGIERSKFNVRVRITVNSKYGVGSMNAF